MEAAVAAKLPLNPKPFITDKFGGKLKLRIRESFVVPMKFRVDEDGGIFVQTFDTQMPKWLSTEKMLAIAQDIQTELLG